MGRIIQGQVIATTGLDRHGERLSREDLNTLFARWPDGLPSGVGHDLSRRPACRTFNKRMELQPDGKLALKVDVEVLDESAFSQFGGFSIAFNRQRIRLGEGQPTLEVTVNSRQFNLDEIVAVVAAACDESDTFEVVERVEKADFLATAIIGIAVFVGLQTFSGFFNATGAALFESLRRQKRKDGSTAQAVFQFHLYLALEHRLPVIILTVEPTCTPADVRSLDGPGIIARIEARFGDLPVQKVAGRILPGGIVEIDHVTGLDGRVLFDSERDL